MRYKIEIAKHKRFNFTLNKLIALGIFIQLKNVYYF